VRTGTGVIKFWDPRENGAPRGPRILTFLGPPIVILGAPSNFHSGAAGRKVCYIRMSEPVKSSSSINVEGWSNESTQVSTMDSASTSDKPDASAPTDDNLLDRRFVIHRYLSQKSYPANFTKVDKHALA